MSNPESTKNKLTPIVPRLMPGTGKKWPMRSKVIAKPRQPSRYARCAVLILWIHFGRETDLAG